VDVLEDATNELHRLCLAAVDHVISEKRLSEFAIPESFHALVERSWRTRQPDIYGRLDLV
jgi:glutathionylspermidine synthase